MNSSNRVKLSIDLENGNPQDEDMVSLDPIEFHSKEDPYEDCIRKYMTSKRVSKGLSP